MKNNKDKNNKANNFRLPTRVWLRSMIYYFGGWGYVTDNSTSVFLFIRKVFENNDEFAN